MGEPQVSVGDYIDNKHNPLPKRLKAAARHIAKIMRMTGDMSLTRMYELQDEAADQIAYLERFQQGISRLSFEYGKMGQHDPTDPRACTERVKAAISARDKQIVELKEQLANLQGATDGADTAPAEAG